MRLVAVQRCPAVPKAPQSAPSRASSRLASSSTIIGFLPPSSSEQRLKVRAQLSPMMRPTSLDPVKEMARTRGCSGERRADVGAMAGDDVDDSGGDSSFGERADEVKDRQRRVLRRLDDTGVAGDKGREELPRRDRHGEVPGADHADDADRLAGTHGELVGQLAGGGEAVHAAAFAGEIVTGVDGFLSVAAGLLEDFSHFAGHVAGEGFLLALQNGCSLHNDLGAAGGGHAAPLF